MRSALILRTIVAFFTAATASTAAHAETWYSLGFTKHSTNKRYCESNPGVFHDWRPWSNTTLFVGVQGKSDCEAGLVLGAAYQPLRLGASSSGVMVLGLTGYDRRSLLIVPAPAFSYEVSKNQYFDLTGWPNQLLHIRWRVSF